jgi:hypothetical protein
VVVLNGEGSFLKRIETLLTVDTTAIQASSDSAAAVLVLATVSATAGQQHDSNTAELRGCSAAHTVTAVPACVYKQ